MQSQFPSKTKTINIKLPTDKLSPCISGCEFMLNGDLVLCDYANKKVKLMHALSFDLKDCITLEAGPWDVSVINDSSAIITVPNHNSTQLLILETTPVLMNIRGIHVNVKCRGVQFVNDRIYVTCNKKPGEGEVRVLDLDGRLKRRIGANQSGSFIFRLPCYLAVSRLTNQIYVSDMARSALTCLTVDGRILYEYNDDELKRVMGVCLDTEENIILCGDDSKHLLLLRKDDISFDRYYLGYSTFQSSTNGLYSIALRHSDKTLALGYMQEEIIIINDVKQVV